MKQESRSPQREEEQSSMGLYFFVGVLALGFAMIVWFIVTSGQ